ncbi:MAG TPA: AraC family transcriptional regulator [Blastocatellia bacterium]
MLKDNPEFPFPRSLDRAPESTYEAGGCSFRPDSRVTDGVYVERQHIPAGATECPALPFLVVSVQDGPPVKVTRKRRGKTRSHMSVIGDVEIYPAGFSEDAVIMDRSTDQLYIGVQPQVISKTAEAAGIDLRRAGIVASFGSQDSTVYHIARRLLQERRNSGPGSRLYTDALVTELVIHLLREYSSLRAREDVRAAAPDPGQLRPALEMIHDDLQANPSLKELADAAHLSPHHFSRIFKRVTGLSPHQYVLSQRVQAARRLLAETTLPITEVAHQVGFYDQSHFTYHFKRLIGVTPSEIRKRKNVLSE